MVTRAAAALSASLEAIRRALITAPVAHFDETGFRVGASWPGCIRRRRGNSR
jgi:hypothetical protein